MFTTYTIDQEMIRDSNQKKILQLLQKRRELTKQEMSQILGLSIPTIATNTNILIAEGLLEEGGIGDSSGGRKPVIIKFLPNARFSFGVDISSQRVRIILTNLDSEILASVEFIDLDFTNIELILQRIADHMTQMMMDLKIESKAVLGVGFSLPGTVDEELGILEMAPSLGLYKVPLQKQFQAYFSAPIYIENEANAAAFGELTLGIAQQMKNLVYLSVTHGIGAGIVIKGHLYKGKNKRAGEFGHMTLIPNGKQCKCGRNGCWELYASVQTLLSRYRASLKAECLPTSITLKSFFNDLAMGNSMARKVWDEYLDYLTTGIQNIILTLDPHYIVVGGDISLYEDYLLPDLQKKIFTPNAFYEEGDTSIVISTLKENATILGASLLPMKNLLFQNESIL